jgi:hypothetical protein
MRLRYDLHLHSCLSPCGDAEMSPYNLVNLAKLLDLDIVALTDHNTAGNCRSALRAGEEAGIVVVPGMELTTSEEVHVVCLFRDCAGAEAFGEYVRGSLPPIPNRPDIFGEQLLMDSREGVLGSEEILLIGASGISIERVRGLCAGYGGVCFPAHIDRSSYSILSNLGSLVPELGFRCAEVSRAGDARQFISQHPALGEMRVLRSSDAHCLHDMCEALDTLDLPANTPGALVDYLSEPLI